MSLRGDDSCDRSDQTDDRAKEKQPSARRPAGLGAKRIKVGAPEHDNQQGLFFELDENATTLDEMKAMLESAEACLDDPEKALPLLRGIIHECDALLRASQKDNNCSDPDTTETSSLISSAFYTLYGDALFMLGQLEFKDNAVQIAEFIREAIERYEAAMLRERSTSTLIKKTVAHATLFAIDEECSLSPAQMIGECFEVAKDDPDSFRTLLNGLLEAADEAGGNQRMVAILRAVRPFMECPDGSLGLDALKFANMFTEASVEDLIEEELDDQEGPLQKLESFLRESIQRVVQDSSKPESDSLVPAGEAHMLLGCIYELLDDKKESQKAYKLAADLFARADKEGIQLNSGMKDIIAEFS